MYSRDDRAAVSECGLVTTTTPVSASDAARDESFMRRCLELARRALDAGDVPVGAIVVRDDRVIGEGCERTRQRLRGDERRSHRGVREAVSGAQG